jgi:hypothetical protein
MADVQGKVTAARAQHKRSDDGRRPGLDAIDLEDGVARLGRLMAGCGSGML